MTVGVGAPSFGPPRGALVLVGGGGLRDTPIRRASSPSPAAPARPSSSSPPPGTRRTTVARRGTSSPSWRPGRSGSRCSTPASGSSPTRRRSSALLLEARGRLVRRRPAVAPRRRLSPHPHPRGPAGRPRPRRRHRRHLRRGHHPGRLPRPRRHQRPRRHDRRPHRGPRLPRRRRRRPALAGPQPPLRPARGRRGPPRAVGHRHRRGHRRRRRGRRLRGRRPELRGIYGSTHLLAPAGRFYVLRAGDRFDLAERRRRAPYANTSPSRRSSPFRSGDFASSIPVDRFSLATVREPPAGMTAFRVEG